MKTPQVPHGVLDPKTGKELTTPLGLPRSAPTKDEYKVGDTIELTNPDLVLDPTKPAYIKRTL